MESESKPTASKPAAPPPASPSGTSAADRSPADAPAPPARPRDWWTALNDEQLLDVRMCDLDVTIEGSKVEAAIAELHAEADARNLAFKPHYWLSDEWFTPDGVAGIAIPFYLAHPRLEKLEERADARGRGRHPRLVPRASSATRRATPSTTPIRCTGGASG